MSRFTRRRKITAVTVLAFLVVAGAAFAYWTTTGSGTGAATTGASSAVSVAQTGTVTGLVPGGAAQAVNFTITNPKTTPQRVATVTVAIASITNITGGTPATGCTTADFTLVQPTAINTDLAAGATAFVPSGATLAMIDSASNQDGCQNVTVNLTFAAA
jgi:hypothetical protein